MITTAIDTHEKRDVAIYDLPGAFLNADIDEDGDSMPTWQAS